MASSSRTYRFGPRDRRGLVFGVKSSQALLVAGVLVVAVGELRALHGPIRLVVVVQLGAGLATAFVPVRGRSVEEWLPIVARFSSAALTGAHREVTGTAPLHARVHRRSVFSRFAIIEIVGDSTRRLGAISDERTGALSGALVVSGEAFSLLDDDERERRVARWSAVLSSLGASPAAPWRVQWVERTVPDRRETLHRRVAAMFADADARGANAAEGATDGAIARARASYEALVQAESAVALRHEVVLTVSVRNARRSGRRGDPSVAASDARKQALVAALVTLERRCRDAGIHVDGALSSVGLRSYLARTFAASPSEITSSPWPLACETSWSCFRTDGTWHATYWIAEWPRHDVGSDFLLPLLNDSGERRALTLVMEPVASGRAVRRAEVARTSARADSELRHRHGFVLSARSSREQDAVLRREDELAAGHAAFRFSGYLSVTGASVAALEQSCARLEQAAALARLELRRLYGSQGESFLYTLPLGRGLG